MMLTSLALTFLLGLLLGFLSKKINLPTLVGLLFTGIILGPSFLDVMHPNLLGISVDLRQVALVVILTRAGLALDLQELKKAGRPAFLLCFVPAICELIGITLIAPHLLDVTYLEAALIGSIVAAVSPAVIVPKMLKMMEEGYGTKKSIPQMIMAAGSVDDVVVIVIFTVLASLLMGHSISALSFAHIPISIIVGLGVGISVGFAMVAFFKAFHMRDTIKVIILLSVCFLILALEHTLKDSVPMSGLLAIMSVGVVILQRYAVLAKRLSVKYSKLWVAAEILLFVLVGAEVNVDYAMSSGLNAILVVLGGLVFRMVGVYLSVVGTPLSNRERLFCMIAYMPKATVQAAIGSLPLAWGLKCGETALTVAVLAILITAPLGAFGIERTYKLLLNKGGELDLTEDQKEEQDTFAIN